MKNPVSLEETLLPAFLQCFGIMFLGYILGKFGVLGKNEANGISKFVQYLALPSLIFVRISTMAFNDVKWEFIASVFVTKACIFACVVLMTILLTHPPHLGKSGIYAIATTQSNDFALAYPMLISIYKNSHTEYPSYMYIIAPIQLVILNTIGFFMIETQKQFDDTTTCHIWQIIKGTLKNPVVVMTIIGIIWNVSFGNTVLPLFSILLQTLSIAFPATALFLVGHTMATKSGKADNNIPITVTLLIIAKNLIMPIILQKFSALMLQSSSQDEIQSLSSFGFLYGTIPTAPTVYVFAVQYNVAVDVITKTIIGGTLLSAPLMFASASVISLSQTGIEKISFYMSLTIRYLSCISIICYGWLLFSFIIGKRFRNISFEVTLYIFLAQFLTSIGGFLLFFSEPNYTVVFYAQYILSIGGIYATRVCTFFLAIILLVIRWRSLCYILQMKKHIKVISVLCLIVPFTIAAMALFSSDKKSAGPDCQIGHIQTVITFGLTIVCLIATVLCLILQHVCFRKKLINETNMNVSTYQAIEESENTPPQTSTNVKIPNRPLSDDEISLDVEDLNKHFEDLLSDSENLLTNDIQNDLCNSSYHCSGERRLRCANNIISYRNEQKEVGIYDDEEIFQHTTILIALIVSMTCSLAVSLWRIIEEEIDAIFIQFLNIIMNYGLGILFFIIFGFDKGVIDTISNKWKTLKSLRCGKQTIITENLTTDIYHDFMTNYERKFRMDMNSLKTAQSVKFANVFCTTDLSDWLIENGAVRNINGVEAYILNLQEAQIIQKIDTSSLFSENESIFRLICDEM